MSVVGELEFLERVDKAIHDSQMRSAVPFTQDRLRMGREQATHELGNLEEWREAASEIRMHTIENLDSYLEQLATNVRENGGHVHFAFKAEDAVLYVSEIVRKKGAKTIIKSKSMVSEEIHLNKNLEEMGVKVVESDLGEYIIQLAGEAPSHLIAPAIHKTKEQVAELFSKEAGREIPVDTNQLLQFAREQLRKEFLEADIGISGCNFAVAESGSVVLISNEGNARLTTTLPKVHIAIMGMERLVPTWQDLDVVVSMLTRSATGQKITSYVTGINGPRLPEDMDGPEEFHLIILDNGRSNILGTAYQEVLKCIRCGACVNVCPVYRNIGGHAYGSTYSGPIGAVLAPLLEGYVELKELPFASSLCGACTDVCPVRIPLHDLLIEHRKDEVEQGFVTKFEQLAFKGFSFMASHPFVYEKAVKMARTGLSIFAKDGYIANGPGPLKGWTESRDFPKPAKQSFRDWWEKEKRDS
ncbi:LutB/LldF family L-lactate oxidation iron-sulfur protein [Bacillus pseudomycoides]|uniref:LutB/LldF family L-lactate oxidation iron-sulfur protein n=1 Tax=Bacillus pseudomycoides TaxID=64104 RepID=UPI000BEB6FAF|nr:LutB/LldF family L-lactate oxidation iron-sulfur protein [Bacillus pseudomycoides]PEB39069.1 iron-sulfur cluster-binding protein [Bacillus pseudomycoides]PGD90685.1 iron-sulfur cluster-binding protein [Bacillus pseudomycoides]PGE00246.1 iron-sulfur cluster-binding protein [Bacillus pseudomycoides]PHE66186.1 iron-sulfur cluster-binding protein [Bacillus pseudomycoides]PHG17486.1 iron-sulfur cluster-binding protein [Bacillus pseudomycoides]